LRLPATTWMTVTAVTAALLAGADEPRTQLVTPGARYAAGGLKTFVFGSHYRRLWTTSVRVEVLDLHTFAGGLKPVKKGGGHGKQTLSIKFESADGREWKLRSVDKDPKAALPEELRNTVVQEILQDQISAGFPTGPLVVDALADAAGLRHAHSRLVVLPDDPALGEFRAQFAGVLGFLEEVPRTEDPVTPGFEGLVKPIGTEDLWPRLDAHPEESVNARAFAYARLFDVLIGDFDRHDDQWDWTHGAGSAVWDPIPKDRDQAFARFNGLVLGAFRKLQPALVAFDRAYPDMINLTWQARFVDRRHLAALTRAEWVRAGAELQARMTDPVIEAAVRRLPPEHYAIEGARLAERLRARRDALPEAALRFYELLAAQAEVELTDAPERVEVLSGPDGDVRVRASLAGDARAPVLFDRTYHANETHEIRIFLKGGDDQLVTRGRPQGIVVRVVGGAGDDLVDDSAGGGLQVYDDAGDNRVVDGPGTSLNRTPWAHEGNRIGDRPEHPPRDWGVETGLVPMAAVNSDLGLFAGASLQRTSYGFRRFPYATRQSIGAGYSTALRGARVEYRGAFVSARGPQRVDVLARFSDIELLRFNGFGNDSPRISGLDPFYRVHQRQYAFSALYRLNVPQVDLAVGPIVKYASTDLSRDTFVARERPYGVGDFGQAGARARLLVGRTAQDVVAPHASWLALGGTYYPRGWSVASGFGEVDGEAGLTLHGPGFLRPTVALRAGGKRVIGTYPFQEAAYVGGPDTLRGLRPQRYAGDASAYGNAELRVRLGRPTIVVPTDVGVFGFFDAGRVFLAGERSDTWHHGTGGGLWLGFLRPENAVTATVARSEGVTRFYARVGFLF
jgi:hypothetical protein